MKDFSSSITISVNNVKKNNLNSYKIKKKNEHISMINVINLSKRIMHYTHNSIQTVTFKFNTCQFLHRNKRYII